MHSLICVPYILLTCGGKCHINSKGNICQLNKQQINIYQIIWIHKIVKCKKFNKCLKSP